MRPSREVFGVLGTIGTVGTMVPVGEGRLDTSLGGREPDQLALPFLFRGVARLI
jgi:hypothetical protein